ncbi:MAG: DEAD/DEAH box helicase [Myxococcota bacterium]
MRRMYLDSNSHAERPDAFRELGLMPVLCRAVADAGYTTPTPIQNAGIPVVLDGRDLLGCAQTGSGKTAAFALPILDRLMRRRPERGRHGVRALVLAPTRELAAQIGDCFATYGAGSSIRHMVVFGGVNKNPQVRALRRPPEVLVACPGRLLDLMQNDGLELRDVECVVLDEADRMLDMGFIHDVRKIVAALPKDRQNLLFSATMPAEIEKLSRSLLRDPERVAVDPISSTAGPIDQSVYFVGAKQKQSLLTNLLRSEEIGQALVFTRTKHGANRVAQKLEGAGVPAAAIHGNKSQGARERAMGGFRSGAIRVVVATDLASRGIDVKHLSHVINFDLPNIAETYVHRVGRTGRAGATGVALSLCSDEERPYLRDI